MSKDNPNFTVITSGGCNAKCEFCTDPMNYKPSPDYIEGLIKAISKLPSEFEVVSVSGGEPTISPDLYSVLTILKFSNRFKRIVLTTNGTNLKSHLNIIKATCTHVNISRHDVGYENNVNIFKNKRIISDEDIKFCTSELNKSGIPVTFNHVYKDEQRLTTDYVEEFINYAKTLNISDVCFRHDHSFNNLKYTELENQLFRLYKTTMTSNCPVCRTHGHVINGMNAYFKSSYVEPSNQIGDVYELIYHPSAKLTTDWDGNNVYEPKPIVPSFIPTTTSREYERGCGRGGC